jgi:hypothetical protein
LEAKFPDCVPEPFRIGLEYVELRSHPLRLVARGPRSGLSSNAIRADLTGGSARPKPQVTRVIGVFDPHSLEKVLARLRLGVAKLQVKLLIRVFDPYTGPEPR